MSLDDPSAGEATPLAARPRTISIKEVAEVMGVSLSTAYEAVHKKQIPAVRVGRLLRVPVAALERMLEGVGP